MGKYLTEDAWRRVQSALRRFGPAPTQETLGKEIGISESRAAHIFYQRAAVTEPTIKRAFSNLGIKFYPGDLADTPPGFVAPIPSVKTEISVGHTKAEELSQEVSNSQESQVEAVSAELTDRPSGNTKLYLAAITLVILFACIVSAKMPLPGHAPNIEERGNIKILPDSLECSVNQESNRFMINVAGEYDIPVDINVSSVEVQVSGDSRFGEVLESVEMNEPGDGKFTVSFPRKSKLDRSFVRLIVKSSVDNKTYRSRPIDFISPAKGI